MTQDSDYYYWNKGEDIGFNGHFGTKEFTCHCTHPTCVQQKVSKALVARLTSVRADLGKAMNISSGFRCAAKQQDLAAAGYETAKGVSQHELGNASDVLTEGAMAELLQLLTRTFKAVGVAHTFIHVDLRDDKERRWSYSTM